MFLYMLLAIWSILGFAFMSFLAFYWYRKNIIPKFALWKEILLIISCGPAVIITYIIFLVLDYLEYKT